jgi:hypothetical protein
MAEEFLHRPSSRYPSRVDGMKLRSREGAPPEE